MAKTKISEFSSTPANNTDIDSINIAEGCSPSGINDAIRELMAQLKDWQSGTSNDPYVVGSSGSLTLNQGTANTVPYLNGSKVVTSGTALSFDGTNLGLGVTPSSWATVTALQVQKASLYGYGNELGAQQNAYYNAGWKYIGTGSASQYQQNSGAHSWYNAPSGTAGNAITFTQAMTLDASGNLGIGTTSPASKLHVVGNTRITADIESTGNSIIYSSNGSAAGTINAGVYLVGSDSSTRFYTGNSERARIDSSGNLLVGCTSAPSTSVTGYKVSGNILTGATTSSTGASTSAIAHYQFLNANGTVGQIYTTGSSTVFATSSDYRLKNSIAPMTGALAKVALLKPCTYKWNADGSDGQGFIAHELAQVCPDAVVGEKDAVDENGNPQYQGIDVSFLVATLTAALQEAHGLIKNLETRISALEAK